MRVRFNLNSLNQQVDDARKESCTWKSAWEQTIWEQEEVKRGLEARISKLKRSLKESQVSTSRECRL